MRKSFFRNVVLLSWIVLLVPGVLLAQSVAGPTEQLRPVLERITTILVDPALQGAAQKEVRREKIMVSVKQGFDFKEMSRRILGRQWQKISGEDRRNFTLQMTKLLENVYIGKLEAYSGQTVTYLGERIKGKRAQVSTVIEDNGTTIPVHYIMHYQAKRWLVYDVNIEGVSLVRNYKEQFASVLRTKKFPGLLEALKEKNSSFVE